MATTDESKEKNAMAFIGVRPEANRLNKNGLERIAVINAEKTGLGEGIVLRFERDRGSTTVVKLDRAAWQSLLHAVNAIFGPFYTIDVDGDVPPAALLLVEAVRFYDYSQTLRKPVSIKLDPKHGTLEYLERLKALIDQALAYGETRGESVRQRLEALGYDIEDEVGPEWGGR